MAKDMFFFIGCLIFLYYKADGQQLKPSNIQYYQDYRNDLQQSILQQNISIEKNIFASKTSTLQVSSSTYGLKCDLPKGAIFCRMEDAIYCKLNFWIKFRIGTDDRYSN